MGIHKIQNQLPSECLNPDCTDTCFDKLLSHYLNPKVTMPSCSQGPYNNAYLDRTSRIVAYLISYGFAGQFVSRGLLELTFIFDRYKENIEKVTQTIVNLFEDTNLSGKFFQEVDQLVEDYAKDFQFPEKTIKNLCKDVANDILNQIKTNKVQPATNVSRDISDSTWKSYVQKDCADLTGSESSNFVTSITNSLGILGNRFFSLIALLIDDKCELN